MHDRPNPKTTVMAALVGLIPPQTTIDPAVMGTPEDYQLARALDMLRGIALFNGRVVN